MPLSFRVLGAGGEPLTAYEIEHEKPLHLIVVRRDGTGFQHVHPELDVSTGAWTTEVDLRPGDWRVLADFVPAGTDEGLTLGADLAVPGAFEPAAVAPETRTAEVGPYTVTLDGDLTAGADAELTLSVERDGRPVTDLQPYLGAYGHLVALRDGDLAYLHVHPEHAGAGEPEAGPQIGFVAEVAERGALPPLPGLQARRPRADGAVHRRGVAMSADVELAINGMTCASCATRIERKLDKLDGVVASVNYATEKARVTYPENVSTDDLLRTVEQAGYTAELPRPELHAGRLPGGGRRGSVDAPAGLDPALHRLLVSAALTLPVIAMAMVPSAAGGLLAVALTHAGGAGGLLGWLAVPPGRGQPAARRRHHGHPGLARHAGGVRLVGLRALLGHGRDARHDASLRADDRAHRRRRQHLLRGRRRRDDVPARRSLARGRSKRQAGAALRALMELGAKDVAVLRDGAEVRVPVGDWRSATSSSSGPARRSPPTASS